MRMSQSKEIAHIKRQNYFMFGLVLLSVALWIAGIASDPRLESKKAEGLTLAGTLLLFLSLGVWACLSHRREFHGPRESRSRGLTLLVQRGDGTLPLLDTLPEGSEELASPRSCRIS